MGPHISKAILSNAIMSYNELYICCMSYKEYRTVIILILEAQDLGVGQKQGGIPYAIATPLIHTLWNGSLIRRVWIARCLVDVYHHDLCHRKVAAGAPAAF